MTGSISNFYARSWNGHRKMHGRNERITMQFSIYVTFRAKFSTFSGAEIYRNISWRHFYAHACLDPTMFNISQNSCGFLNDHWNSTVKRQESQSGTASVRCPETISHSRQQMCCLWIGHWKATVKWRQPIIKIDTSCLQTMLLQTKGKTFFLLSGHWNITKEWPQSASQR